MRPVVRLEVIVPRIFFPLSQIPATVPEAQQSSLEEVGEVEDVHLLQFTTSTEVGQKSQVELSSQRPQKKRFRLFQIQKLPITNEVFKLQIWRRGRSSSQSPDKKNLVLSDEIAFSLDLIQQEEPIPIATTPINSDIYQIRLYFNAEGILIGHQIDNSDI